MYNRILLKLSGELLAGEEGFGLSPEALSAYVLEISKLFNRGVKIGIVIGGGNIFRGSALIKKLGFPEPKAHQMGMLSTLINGMALESAFRKIDTPAQNFSAISIEGITKRFNIDDVLEKMEKSVVIFTGGTGNPFFSTDTAAALRAAEIGAEVLIKATKVDGVYDKDPKKYEDAIRFDEITYNEFLDKELGVMDQNAIALCRDRKIPVVVFDFSKKENLEKLFDKKCKYSIIK